MNRLQLHTPSAKAQVITGIVPVPAGFTGTLVARDVLGHPLPTEQRITQRWKDWWHLEVATIAGPGERYFDLVEGQRPERPSYDPAVVSMISKLELEIEDYGGAHSRFKLFKDFSKMHRRGRLCATTCQHVDLDRFGWIELWISARALSDQVDFEMAWHNGTPAPGVNFKRARIVVPSGAKLVPVVTDPSMGPQGIIVRYGRHVIPQRMARPFRFALVPASKAYAPPALAVGDWHQGGLLAGQFPLPSLARQSAAIDAEARRDLAALRADMWTSPSLLWPAEGSEADDITGTYGGPTGGYDMWPLYGVRLAWSGNPDLVEQHQTEELRIATRMRFQTEEDGSPVNLDRPVGWKVHGGLFYRDEDSPWQFDQHASNIAQADYDPTRVFPFDMQHSVHWWNQEAALATLTNSPLSIWLLRTSAAVARQEIHESMLTLPAAPGTGTRRGRADCWCAIHQAYDAAYGGQRQTWMSRMVTHLAASQMPSGLLQASTEYKEASLPPYGDGTPSSPRPYRIGSGREMAYFALALTAMKNQGALGVDPILANLARGLRDLAWPADWTGPMAWYPAGMATGTLFATRADFPPELASALATNPAQADRDAYYIGFALPCLPGSADLKARFTRGQDPGSWGLYAPSLQSGAPIEQFWPSI